MEERKSKIEGRKEGDKIIKKWKIHAWNFLN